MGINKRPSIATLALSAGLVLSLLVQARLLREQSPAAAYGLLFAGLLFLINTINLVIKFVGKSSVGALTTETLPFDLLVQNSGDLIGISNTQGKIIYLNEAGRRIAGIANDVDVSNLNRLHFYPVASHALMNAEVLPKIFSEGSWSGEIEYRNQVTGEEIPVLANFFRLADPVTNERVGMAVIARDLRDRRKLERQFDRFFDVSIDLLGIANHDGYFVKVNAAFTRILGYSAEEMRARPIVDFVHPDDVEKTRAEAGRQRAGHELIGFQNRYRTKSGEYRWFSWSAYSDETLVFGAGRDITEEKRHLVDIEELSRQAIAASEAKSRFLTNMSHEIRTPINGVVGMAGLLLNTKLDTKQTEFAESVRASARELLTIVGDIFDFSKVEAGELALEITDFNLRQFNEDLVYGLARQSLGLAAPVELQLLGDLPVRVRGDVNRLRRVLGVLLGNAIKFSPGGRVRLSVRAEDQHLKFDVVDTGVGMSPVDQAQLFKAFSQADDSSTRKFGGTGLGLSIAKGLVDLMGGSIGVRSQLGQGSTFWVSVPLGEPNAKSERKTERPGPTKYSGAEILIAEDNLLNQKIIVSMVNNLGFSARAVANGVEALDALARYPVDLILMDCQMPELDGYEATRRIRTLTSKLKSTVPIIALTANALKGDRELCLAAGMDDYAAKPIETEQLARLIERWLDVAKAA